MFIVVKACFLVGLICFSFCKVLVVDGLEISDPIINPPGPKSLVPLINITLEIELPQRKCCPSCNPPATCKPCPTCSPVTTCTPCPPPITCPTCPPSITCDTCKTCPPPTTCPTCEPCPTPTACPAASTCPPDFGKTCEDANAIYCAIAGVCVTTVFSPRNYSEAADKCRSLSTTRLNFKIINQYIALVEENILICLRRTVPTMVVDGSDEEIWDEALDDVFCFATKLTVVGDQIDRYNDTRISSCEPQLPFYCVAKL